MACCQGALGYATPGDATRGPREEVLFVVAVALGERCDTSEGAAVPPPPLLPARLPALHASIGLRPLPPAFKRAQARLPGHRGRQGGQRHVLAGGFLQRWGHPSSTAAAATATAAAAAAVSQP